MVLAPRYLKTIHDLLGRIGAEQMENIEKAGEMISECWASGGAVFITDMGHGVAQEMLNRAGGLMALRHLKPEIKEDNLRTVVEAGELKACDVVLVGSVSGRNRWPIELALECRRMGVKVIVLTSLEYTSQVTSLHPSGKKLADVGDLVVDICVPYGDASLEVEGLPVKALPVSGVAFITILWMICGEAIEKMLARGLRPHIYMSNNRPGGPEFNERELNEYSKTGY